MIKAKQMFIIMSVLVISFLIIPNYALAVPLNGEYTIDVITTQIDADSFVFTYNITNVNQQIAVNNGLDGFYIQLPSTGAISNITISFFSLSI